MKTCNKCKETKTYDNFTKDARRGDGHYPSCKACKYLTVLVWRQKNQAKVAGYNKGRTSLMVNEVPKGAWEAMLVFYEGKCAKCDSTEDLTFDHVVPVTKGGKHELRNAQILCRKCNGFKGNRSEADYRTDGILVDCIGY